MPPLVAALVSIRAPAWGATHITRLDSTTLKFQFALPRGERRTDRRARRRLHRFNSRSRVGSDAPPAAWLWALQVSIRAPAWGATGAAHPLASAQDGFNSRSRVGSDDSVVAAGNVVVVSIRAPAWGATKIQRGARR